MKRLYYIPTDFNRTIHSPYNHYYSIREDGTGTFYVMRDMPNNARPTDEGAEILNQNYDLIPVCKLRKKWPGRVLMELSDEEA